MAITRVGASQGANSTSNGSLTRTAGTVGNIFVVGFGIGSGSATPSIADTQGNTWHPCNPVFNDATNANTVQSWYCEAKNTTSTTITVTGNGGAVFTSITLDEFTGQLATGSLDRVAHSPAGNAGTPTSPSITPGQDNELIWAYTLDSVTAVGNIGGSAATKGGDDGSSDWSEFRVLVGGSGVGITAAFTGSGAYDLIAATFKAAAAAGNPIDWLPQPQPLNAHRHTIVPVP